MRGVTGAFAAIAVVTIPTALLVVWLTRVCVVVGGNPWAHAAIAGTISAAVGTMVAAALNLMRVHLSRSNWLPTVLIVGASFALAQWLLSPIQVLGLAALAGLVWPRR